MPGSVIALVLAAGSSRRFLSDKRIAKLAGGCSVLEQTIECCVEAGLEVLLVLGPGDDLLSEYFNLLGIKTLINPDASIGIGSSLAAGASAASDTAALLVVLGDMPYVKPATLRILADKLLAGAGIVRPLYRQRPGNPVGFSSHYYPCLTALSGDRGGRNILLENPAEVVDIDVEDGGVIRDIDYPADLPAT
jgi:molybdenum cofactor cytidylyltransferase